MLEIPYNCHTVGGKLKRAACTLLDLLLYPETEWKIHVGKQGHVFILTDFKKRCFDVSFLASTKEF